MGRVVSGLTGIVLLISLAACGEKAAQAPAGGAAPAAVALPGSAVMVTETRTIYPSFELPAMLESVQSARIRPEVSAAVIANHFTAGDTVAQGQLLVELDDARFQAELGAARAELEAAEAGVLQAESNWQRAEDLMPKGFISALDYDASRAAVETARAAVSQAKAQLTAAELKVSRSSIKAPFSGRISKPGHAVGDQVGPLSPTPLFELAQLDPIYVAAGIELGVYNKFTMLRQKLKAEGKEIPELAVSIDLTGAGEYPYEGTFEGWDHASGRSRGTVTGRSLFPNPDGILLPGQSVVLRGKAIEPMKRIFVPQKAVLQDQQGHFVLVVNDGAIVRKNLEMGVRDGADWAVREGLADGEMVVIEGAQRLAPGMQVTLSNSL